MEQPPVLEPEPQDARSESTPPLFTVWARMVNVFGVPGQVFDDLLRSRPHPAHWWLPAALGFWIGVVATWWAWEGPALRQLWLMRHRAIWEARVEAGLLDRASAEERLARAERTLESPWFRSSVVLEGGLQSGLRFLVWAGVGWALARWAWRRKVPWSRCCEVSGLASLIGLLGDVVSLLLLVPGGDFPAAASSEGEALSPVIERWLWMVGFVQSLLAFWHMAVLGLGMSKLTGLDWVRVLWWLVGLRLIWMVVAGLVGLGLGM